MKVSQIKSEETYDWLKNLHYAKRIPHISYAFGLYSIQDLIGVITYGNPPSPRIADGVCNDKNRLNVRELNRLCLLYNRKNEASFLISKSLKLLPKPSIVISYADTSINHTGYIYQASNFIYCGLSEKRTDWLIKGQNKHGRNISNQYSYEHMKSNLDTFYQVNRPRKHRYVYFVCNKKEKKSFLSGLKLPIQPYPKSKNVNYETNHIPQTQMSLI